MQKNVTRENAKRGRKGDDKNDYEGRNGVNERVGLLIQANLTGFN